MEYSEIIKALEFCLKTNQAYKCTECRYYNKTANCLRRLMTDTVGFINLQQAELEKLKSIKAIEKQIPRKCKNFKDICDCGKSVYPHMKYCSDCGQALDWSGEE